MQRNLAECRFGFAAPFYLPSDRVRLVLPCSLDLPTDSVHDEQRKFSPWPSVAKL